VRLFVAVWPPPEVVDRLAGLPRPEVTGLRWSTPDQWHVTLRFLGEVEGDERDRLDHALAAVDLAALGTVTAVAGPATDRFGTHVLHVPVAGLDPLAAAVLAATADVGEPSDPQPFHAHLTLARARSRGRGVDLRMLTGQLFSARWVVTELTLVSSRTRPQGAAYEVVARRALGD
jgi:2'-5' RNA ligase